MTFRAAILTSYVSLTLCLAGSSAVAARYVPVRISLDGEVILEGNLSDDGDRDADELWDALKSANLRETDAFRELQVAPDLKELTIGGSAGKQETLPVQVTVKYGGVAQSRAITIRRMPSDRVGSTWRVSAEDVDELFNRRLLSRREVAKLADPKMENRGPKATGH